MRASSWMPGTAFVIGVRLPALGAITLRSVMGVKANAGSPGNELLAGVVSGLLVVRSSLAKQLTSARLDPRVLSTSTQVTAAPAGNGTMSENSAAKRIILDITDTSQVCAEPDGVAVQCINVNSRPQETMMATKLTVPWACCACYIFKDPQQHQVNS